MVRDENSRIHFVISVIYASCPLFDQPLGYLFSDFFSFVHWLGDMFFRLFSLPRLCFYTLNCVYHFLSFIHYFHLYGQQVFWSLFSGVRLGT